MAKGPENMTMKKFVVMRMKGVLMSGLVMFLKASVMVRP